VVPEIELQESLGGGGALVAGEGALPCRQLDGLGHSAVVDGLEDLLVEVGRLLAFEGDEELLEDVCESLNSDADGAVAEVGAAGFLDGVVVEVDDLVEVAGADAGDADESLEVKGLVAAVEEGGE
jgi:hypothetical protein